MKKSFLKKIGLLSLAVATTSAGLAACKSNVKVPVIFVAADSSGGYNVEATIGDYSYKFKGQLESGNKFTLKGTVQGRSTGSSGGNQGGPGGGGGDWGGWGGGGNTGGGPGGDPAPTVAVTGVSVSLDKAECYIGEKVTATATITPEDATTKDVEWSSSDETIATVSSGTITTLKAGKVTITAKSKDNPSISASADLTVKVEDYTPYQFSVSGSYRLEKGYGYVLSFDDADKTVIHADYNKTEGRHEFFYNVKVGNNSSFVKFQAKDVTFKSSLAKDYKTWDVRDSKYIFTAKATGNNNSLAYAYLYLHSDGSVVENVPSGVNRNIKLGATWAEDANKNITVTNNGQETKAAKTLEGAEHSGYKLSYDGYAFLCSTNPDVKWKKLTSADFDGETTAEFAGSYNTTGPDAKTVNVQLNLGKDGKAYYYAGSIDASKVGTWTKEGDEFVVDGIVDGTQLKSVTADGKQTITWQISVSSFGGSSLVDVVCTRTK